MPKTQPEPMTTTQVASRLRKSARTVHRLVHRGDLKPAITVPGYRGSFLFDEAEVERYERERQAEQSDEEPAA